MTNFLLKTFVKDHEQTNSSEVREKYGAFAGTVGIIVNIFLFIGKFFAACLSGFAVSVIADSLNNLFDAASSLVTYIGFKLSNKEEDEDHPFGHGRIEYISGLIVSFIIILVGFELCKESVAKIFDAQANSYSIVSIIIMALAVFIKIWLGFFNKNLGKRIKSSALKATALDCFCDVAATTTVLIGLVIGYFFNINVEGYTGTVVALFIMYTGVMSAKDTLSPLLGEAPDEDFVKEIEETVMAHEEIIGIHDLIVHDYGPGRKILSLHAEVSAAGNVIEIHDTIDLIEMELNHKFKCLTTIHMDPLDLNCETTNSLKDLTKKILCDIDPLLSFHDFRIVSGPSHTNLIFDVVIPYNYKYTPDELKALIKKRISQENENYFCVINVDRKFVSTKEQKNEQE